MSNEEPRTQTRLQSYYGALYEFTQSVARIFYAVVMPGEPREQIRNVINILQDIAREMDQIVLHFIASPEGIEYRFEELSAVYNSVLDHLQALLEVEVLGDEEISSFREAGMDLLEHLADLFPDIIQLLDISEESASVLLQFNTLLQRTLESHRPTEEIQIPVAVESNNSSPEFNIEKYTLSYKYKKIPNSSNEEGFTDNCIICLYDLVDEDEARRFPCFHVYHKQCIDEWLRVNQKCPLCRFDFTEETEDFPHLEEGCEAE